MSRDRTPFGDRMFESRRKAGLTQMQVCEALGISQGTLSEAERTANSSARVTDFAQLYAVDPSWLATGREPPTRLERAVEEELVVHGVDPALLRTLRTRRDVIGTIQEFGHGSLALEDVHFVPDYVGRAQDGSLVFIEVKSPDVPIDVKKLNALAAFLPGELILIGGGRPIAEGAAKVAAALGGSAIRGVAHDLSQARNTESLPRIRWEDLMTADLGRPFELDVIDDALAPEIFKGCIALMDPSRPPEPAWPILVRDQDGNHYLRDYEAGPGGRWSAVARARGFAPMDSDAHGLRIIAAMDGYKRPRPLSDT